MAGVYTQPVQALIDELGRLPGIGPKSAQRIAFHLLKLPTDDVSRLAMAISDAKARVRFCARCWNFADAELCPICLDDRRDPTVLCVVEESRDIVSIEKTGEFRGRYHVLLGAMLEFDNRHFWMRLKRLIGSHFANYKEAWEANRLVSKGMSCDL